MKNPIDLTYEETQLLVNLLLKEMTELGIEFDTRFPDHRSALSKLSKSMKNWYAKKSYFSDYSQFLENRDLIP